MRRIFVASFVMMGDNGAVTKKSEYLDVGSRPKGMKLGEQTFSADARRLDTYALEGGQWRLITMVASRVLKPLKSVSLPLETLAGYVGKFDRAGTRFGDHVAGDHLAEKTTDQPATGLMPLGYDTTPDDSPAAGTIFRRDASGKVVAWSYVNGDQEVVARRPTELLRSAAPFDARSGLRLVGVAHDLAAA